MKIFVTGGSGFIGKNLIEALLKQNHQLRVLISEDEKSIFPDNIGIELEIGNLENLKESALEGIDAVYHLAAIRYEWGFNDCEYEKVNVKGTRKILEFSIKNKVKNFIFCSTAFVFGYPKKLPINENFPYLPASLYAESKVRGEKLAEEYSKKGLNLVIIRPSMTYGPKDVDGMLLKLCRLIQDRKFLIIGSGNNFVHLTYIDDLMDGFIKSLAPKSGLRSYIISSNDRITQKKLVEKISEKLEIKSPFLKIPIFLAKTAGLFFEITYSLGKVLKIKFFNQEPLVTRSKVNIIAKSQLFDSRKAQEELGFNPKFKYDEGVEKTIKWFKKNELL
jgi:nucleoside-diphosphate-sugar epimerase